MADDRIAALRSNLVEKGLLGEFDDNVEINRQGKAIPISERISKEEEEDKPELSKVAQETPEPKEEQQKENPYDEKDFRRGKIDKDTDTLKDSCVVS